MLLKNLIKILVATVVFLTNFALIQKKIHIYIPVFFDGCNKTYTKLVKGANQGIQTCKSAKIFFANSIWHTQLFHLKQKSFETFAYCDTFA
jgi:hypothetical protein